MGVGVGEGDFLQWFCEYLKSSLPCYYLCDFGQSASLWPSTSLFIKYEDYLIVTWGSGTVNTKIWCIFFRGMSPAGEKGLWFPLDSPKIQRDGFLNHRISQLVGCPSNLYRIRDWQKYQQNFPLVLFLLNSTRWLRLGTPDPFAKCFLEDQGSSGVEKTHLINNVFQRYMKLTY